MAFLRSASKIVFLMIALTICSGFLLKILSEKEFVTLAMLAFTFYFSKSQGSGNGEGVK